MKLFYGIILVLMVFVSACAQQPAAEPAAQPSAPEPAPAPEPEPEAETAPEAEPEVEGTGAVVAVPEGGSSEIRYVGAGGFDPDTLIISTGSAVTFINGNDKPGAVIIFKDGRSFTNTGRLNPGDKSEQEFTEPGEYEFWWNLVGVVSGKITVE